MALLDELVDVVGARHVLTEADVVAGYTTDWTGRFAGSTPAVVRPASTEEVAEVVRRCRAAGRPIVPQGGNTGLVGGGVPLAGEIVLSLRRLDHMGPVDPTAAQVTAGAGATLESVQRAAADAGLEFAVDLAARGTATIGGMVATNAGGTRVVRHGPMRAQLVGVEAVLGDASVISRLAGLAKDNTGYDLAGLLCGSEGTLGIVTAARLRLVPAPAARATALVAVDGVDASLACLAAVRATGLLEAAELMFDDGVSLVAEHLGVARPLATPAPVYVLFEAVAAADPVAALASAIDGVSERGVLDAAFASTHAQRQALWRVRDAHTEAIASRGVPHKLDVTVPLAGLGEFCDAVPVEVRRVAPRATTILFGHLGDGNVHVNVVGGDVPDAVDAAVLDLVAAARGSVSAEHGIGNAKKGFLHLSRSPAELAAFRAIKRALDPDGVLNPHVLVP